MTDFPGLGGVVEAGKTVGVKTITLLVSSGLSVVFGLAMLFVRWLPPSTPYGACHASIPTWLGCLGGMTPWLPFALLFGGAGTIAATVWMVRR